MNKSYYVDRVHKQIIYTDQEFQHFGILGQKWGVITKNVGVNYVPVGKNGGGKNTQINVKKPSGNQRVFGDAQIIGHLKSQPGLAELRNVPDKYFKKIVNDPTVKNSPNDKVACKNARIIFGNAAWDNWDAKVKFFEENGIDIWQATRYENAVLPGQTMSYKDADYKFYSSCAKDITKELGYSFNTPNAPKIGALMQNDIVIGKMGFYNGKAYDSVDKMMKDYHKDIERGR